MGTRFNQTFNGTINAENVGVVNNRRRSVLDILFPHTNPHAAYNSAEREMEQVSICKEGTRTRILGQIYGWANGNGPPVLWLHGPAGSGKSTIAQTLAEQCDRKRVLALSYFFSRRHDGRNDLTKFIPSLAYTLTNQRRSFAEALSSSIESDPGIFHRNIKDQLTALVVEPLRVAMLQLKSPMILIIDGLDEYLEENRVRLGYLVETLVTCLSEFPFRLFFASRPEGHIRSIFDELSASDAAKHLTIPLQDWETRDDVYRYLRDELSQVQKGKKVPLPWPSRNDLWTLVGKSQGIFMYASTLVKFVGAKNGNAVEKLRKAIVSHNGLDSLFMQVLDNAKEHEDFSYVFGVTMSLRERLSVNSIANLLQRDVYFVNSALEGSLSILFVPEIDHVENRGEGETYIRPYHASLLDFLADKNRSNHHFLDPGANHKTLFHICERHILHLTSSDEGSGDHHQYAIKNWYHHFLLSITNQADELIAGINLVEHLLRQGPCTWLRALEGHGEVLGWLNEFSKVDQVKNGHAYMSFMQKCKDLEISIDIFMEIYDRHFRDGDGGYIYIGSYYIYTWREVCRLISENWERELAVGITETLDEEGDETSEI